MKFETHKCDRCGKTATTEEEKEALGLGSIHLGFSIDSYGGGAGVWAATERWSREWCRACRKELGMLERENKTSPEVTESAPSLEDMVREIVRQELP